MEVPDFIARQINDPDALQRVAQTMTPKLAAALEQQFNRLHVDGRMFVGTPDEWTLRCQPRIDPRDQHL